jgi:hypothetical protein
MVDHPARVQAEGELARDVAGVFQARYQDLVERLGDPPDGMALDDAWWGELEAALLAAILPHMVRSFVDTAVAAADGLGVEPEMDLVNRWAQEWAEGYTYDLVKGMTESRRGDLAKQIARFYDDGVTLGDVREALRQMYSPVRADMIAQTEITRASVGGEMALADYMARNGLNLRAVWYTAQDDRVCPICGPRHGTVRGDGWFDLPPAHVRCRCWVEHEVVE